MTSTMISDQHTHIIFYKARDGKLKPRGVSGEGATNAALSGKLWFSMAEYKKIGQCARSRQGGIRYPLYEEAGHIRITKKYYRGQMATSSYKYIPISRQAVLYEYGIEINKE